MTDDTELPEPTPQQKYEKRKAELEAIVAKYPNCVWARNELKYLSLDDFTSHPRPLLQDRGSRGVCDEAVAAEMRYHGGYVE